jgi:hypothetical protein
LTDTPEEAAYRAKIRAQLQQQREKLVKKNRLAKIKAQEEAKVEKGTLTEQLLTSGKSMLKKAVDDWKSDPKKAK